MPHHDLQLLGADALFDGEAGESVSQLMRREGWDRLFLSGLLFDHGGACFGIVHESGQPRLSHHRRPPAIIQVLIGIGLADFCSKHQRVGIIFNATSQNPFLQCKHILWR